MNETLTDPHLAELTARVALAELGQAVDQALLVPTLAEGESFAAPIHHAVVSSAMDLLRRAQKAEALLRGMVAGDTTAPFYIDAVRELAAKMREFGQRVISRKAADAIDDCASDVETLADWLTEDTNGPTYVFLVTTWDQHTSALRILGHFRSAAGAVARLETMVPRKPRTQQDRWIDSTWYPRRVERTSATGLRYQVERVEVGP